MQIVTHYGEKKTTLIIINIYFFVAIFRSVWEKQTHFEED